MIRVQHKIMKISQREYHFLATLNRHFASSDQGENGIDYVENFVLVGVGGDLPCCRIYRLFPAGQPCRIEPRRLPILPKSKMVTVRDQKCLHQHSTHTLYRGGEKGVPEVAWPEGQAILAISVERRVGA